MEGRAVRGTRETGLRGWGEYRPESLEDLRCGAVWGVVRASVGLP